MKLKIKQQPDGTWLIQGDKSCDYCRPPEWPLDPQTVVGYCGCMASKAFRNTLKTTAKELLEEQAKPKRPVYQSLIDANRRANKQLYFKGKNDE